MSDFAFWPVKNSSFMATLQRPFVTSSHWADTALYEPVYLFFPIYVSLAPETFFSLEQIALEYVEQT